MSHAGPKRFDGFLSYNSQDRPAVKELAERLKSEGLVLYLDEWELAPGKEFQPELAEALRDSKACVVLLGPNGLAPWQKQEILVAIDRRTHDESFHVIPVLLPGTERPRRGDVAHLEFLINASWVEFPGTLDDEQAFRRLVWGIRGTKPEAPPDPELTGACPYRGLEAFRPEDARFFFGREKLSDWLVSELRREVRARPQGVRFLGVIGPSGSGKSSVVLAGLVPKLKAGAIEGSQRWPVAITRPGDEPIANLVGRSVPALQATGTPLDHEAVRTLIKAIRDENDAQALDVFARMALHDRSEDVHLVVVVDQFEELFTYRPEDAAARERFERERAAYLANLLNAAAAPGGRVVVVITMRSDFLSNCASFPQLSAVLSAHQELVGPMTPAELREAIVQPAYLVGHEVEPALVERLLADVKGQGGALPLLQFALTEVWQKREVRRLTLRAYEELGKDEHGGSRGIAGALEHRANEIYTHLSRDDQDRCRRIFLHLVQPGEGTEDTKRRVSYSELLPADPDRALAVKRLIYALSEREARLITTEGAGATDGWVEVAHEALIQGWTQLRQWIDTDRAGLRTQRRLTEAAREWAAAGPEEKDGFLYEGTRLAICRDWAKSHSDELGSVEAEFLAASERAEQESLENERRRREAAESAAKRLQRLSRWLVTAATVGVLLAVTAAGLAIWANMARKDADSRRIAAQSVVERGQHLDLALILAVEALRIADTDEARKSLFDSVSARPGLICFLQGSEGHALTVAFSPDGKTLAVGYGTSDTVGGVELWDPALHTKLADMPLASSKGTVLSAAFSPDGKTLAGACRVGDRNELLMWDIPSRTPIPAKPLPFPGGQLMGVAFSPDGKTVAVGSSGGVVLWDVPGKKWAADGQLAVGEGTVQSTAFSPDGQSLAAGYRSEGPAGGVIVWRVSNRQRFANMPRTVSEGAVRGLAFSPDGKTLAAGYGVPDTGGGVILWKAANWERLTTEPLALGEGEVTSLAFTRDGNALAAGYGGPNGGGVLFFDAVHPRRLAEKPLSASDHYVEGVAFSPDDKTLAVAYGGRGGAVELWGARRHLAVPEGAVTSVAFGGSGKILASAYGRGLVLWDVARRERLAKEPLAVQGDDVSAAIFSPDGKSLAARHSGGLVVWDVVRRERIAASPLPVDEGLQRSLAFSPDGKTLAAGYYGGALVWDMARRKWLADQPLEAAASDVLRVCFSPDGRNLAAACKVDDRSEFVLWDVATRAKLVQTPLPAAGGDVTSVAFSPDGKIVAVGCSAGVLLWDSGHRQWISDEPLRVLEGLVTTVAFSPDAKTLAAGYSLRAGGGVVLWDVESRQRRSGMPPPSAFGAEMSNLAFSPDGKLMAAGSAVAAVPEVLWHAQERKAALEHVGGQVVLWNLDLSAYRNDAATIANRNLTRAEWDLYFPDRAYHATFDNLPVPPEPAPGDERKPDTGSRAGPAAERHTLSEAGSTIVLQ